MKRLIFLLPLIIGLLASSCSVSENKSEKQIPASEKTVSQNTIKFLGIPIDGTVNEIGAKLEEKGFVFNPAQNAYYGEFNGVNVFVYIQTVNNKVWRLTVVEEATYDEVDIRKRFNILFDQFSNNGKYNCFEGEKIADGEEISQNMVIENKRYNATFVTKDSTINGNVWYTIDRNFGNHRIVIYYENLDNAANGEDL